MPSTDFLVLLLQAQAAVFKPIIPLDLNGPQVVKLDFTAQNSLLLNQSFTDILQFEALITQMLTARQASVGIGGYLENRIIYRRSPLFADLEASRSVHLGVDIWAPAGTPVAAPLAGVVHSYQDNAHFGDYGPTIILQHQFAKYTFYTLYGHLSRRSLTELWEGKEIPAGGIFAELGPYPENGDWPPHLHFQIISDLQGQTGDFPGVCSLAEQEKYTRLCPDPNLILQCRHLSAANQSPGYTPK